MNASHPDRETELSNQPLDADDQAILNAVRAMFDETDPVPDGLVERIQFEITLDALHAEVATLTQLDGVGSGARGSSTESVRTVTFTSESLTTTVTVTPQADGTVRVDGWAAPGAGVRVEVHLPSGTEETTADEDGRFVFEHLTPGMAKFALHLSSAGDVSTVLSPTIEL